MALDGPIVFCPGKAIFTCCNAHHSAQTKSSNICKCFGNSYGCRVCEVTPGGVGAFSICLVLQQHTGVPAGVAVPTASPGIRCSSSSRRVLCATTSPCGTIVALDSADPGFRECSRGPPGERALPACHGLNLPRPAPLPPPAPKKKEVTPGGLAPTFGNAPSLALACRREVLRNRTHAPPTASLNARIGRHHRLPGFRPVNAVSVLRLFRPCRTAPTKSICRRSNRVPVPIRTVSLPLPQTPDYGAHQLRYFEAVAATGLGGHFLGARGRSCGHLNWFSSGNNRGGCMLDMLGECWDMLGECCARRAQLCMSVTT